MDSRGGNGELRSIVSDASRLQEHWDGVRAYLHGLRVAWVATGSVLAGLALFLTPQAQDLFLEVRGSIAQDLEFWLLFYVVVLMVWMLPVYVSARWIMWECREGCVVHADARPVARNVRRKLPPLLAVGCLTAVVIGQVLALWNVPDLVDLSAIEEQLDVLKKRTPEVCKAFAGLQWVSSDCALTLSRLLGTSAAWIFQSEWRLGAEFMIIALYLFVLWLFLWGAAGARIHRIPNKVWRIVLASGWWALTIVALPVGLIISLTFFGALWEEAGKPNTLVHLAALPAASLLIGLLIWRALKPRQDMGTTWLGEQIARWRGGALVDREHAAAVLVGWLFRILVGLSALATILLFVAPPIDVARYVYRVVMVPFLLGPLVAPLTALSFGSVRLQAPLVAAIALLIGVVSTILGDGHGVRTLSMPPGASRDTLHGSLERWAKANGCSLEQATGCPSPIIVAAAGGASRAGFLTAGLIGKLLDERVAPGPPGQPPRPLRPFDRQLFAISAVSGGALGAVMTVAALADKRSGPVPDSSAPPCRENAGRDDRQWFRSSSPGQPTSAALAPHVSWRSCLELLLAGDFLSPVFVRMISNDLVGIGADRSVTLEQSWERRYRDITGRDTLAEGLVAVRRRAMAGEGWLPLVLLNGTSVETGRRIITSDVDIVRHTPSRDGRILRQQLHLDADDLHEMLARRSPSVAARAAAPRDLRLSTSATMSARFPVISPHGSITNADGRIIDRVVDGGYYENFGAATALELARELSGRYRLAPTIVLVSNEPTPHAIDCLEDESNRSRQAVAAQWRWFSLWSSPLDAVINTRSARGSYAAVELCSFIRSDATNGTFASIRVKPSGAKPLSMSWWLSKHVQQYLDLHLSVAPGDREPTTRDREFTEVNRDALQVITERRGAR